MPISLDMPEQGVARGFERILITGAGGFVGSRLIRALAGEWRKADIVSASRSDARSISSFPEIDFDLCDPASVRKVVRHVRPDLVVHLAAQSSVAQGEGAAAETWGVNLAGSLALADAISALDDVTVLFASSSEVYGEAFNAGEVTEVTPPQPKSIYAQSKLSAEMVFASVLRHDQRLIVARPSNHSGAGQTANFVLPSFAGQIQSGASQIKVGNLAAERDFLHVDDVVDAYIDLLQASPSFANRQTFNIASGKPISIQSLLNRMIELSGRSVEIVVDPSRLRASDVPRTALNIDRIRSQTNWSVKRDVDQILQDVLEGDNTNALARSAPERGSKSSGAM